MPRKALSVSALRDGGIAGQANARLYRLCLRANDVDGAIATLEQMLSRRQMGIFPHIELAKIYEHRTKDYKKALRHTRQALDGCCADEEAPLRKREARIMMKICKADTQAQKGN